MGRISLDLKDQHGRILRLPVGVLPSVNSEGGGEGIVCTPTAVSFIADCTPTALSFIEETEIVDLDLPMYAKLDTDLRYSEFVAAYTPYVPPQLTIIAMAGNIDAGVIVGDKIRFGDTSYDKTDVDLAKLYGFDLSSTFSALLNYRLSRYFSLYQLPMFYSFIENGKDYVTTEYKHAFGGLAYKVIMTDLNTKVEKVLFSNLEYEDIELEIPMANGDIYSETVRKFKLSGDTKQLNDLISNTDKAIKEQILSKLNTSLDPNVLRTNLTSGVKSIAYSGVNGITNDQYIFHIETAVLLKGTRALPTTMEEVQLCPYVRDSSGGRHRLYMDFVGQLLTSFNQESMQYIYPQNVGLTKAGAIQFRELIFDGESFDRNSTRMVGAKAKLGAEQPKTAQQLTYLIDDQFTQTISLRENIGDNLTRLLDENGKVIGLVSIYNKYSTRTMEFKGGVICLNNNGEFVLQSGRLLSPQIFGFTNGFVKTKSRKITFLETSDTNQKFQQQLQGTELMTWGYLN